MLIKILLSLHHSSISKCYMFVAFLYFFKKDIIFSYLKCLKLYEKNISYNKEKKILNLHYYTIDFIDFNALFDE